MADRTGNDATPCVAGLECQHCLQRNPIATARAVPRSLQVLSRLRSRSCAEPNRQVNEPLHFWQPSQYGHARRPLDGTVDTRDLKAVFFGLRHPAAFGRIARGSKELDGDLHLTFGSSVNAQGPTRSQVPSRLHHGTRCSTTKESRTNCGRGEIGRRSRLQLECPRGNPWSRTAQSRGKLTVRPKPIPSQAPRGKV